jgi:hypothetical protein
MSIKPTIEFLFPSLVTGVSSARDVLGDDHVALVSPAGRAHFDRPLRQFTERAARRPLARLAQRVGQCRKVRNLLASHASVMRLSRTSNAGGVTDNEREQPANRRMGRG